MRDRGGPERSDNHRHRSPAEEARRSRLLWGVVIFGVVAFVFIYLFESDSGSLSPESSACIVMQCERGGVRG